MNQQMLDKLEEAAQSIKEAVAIGREELGLPTPSAVDGGPFVGDNEVTLTALPSFEEMPWVIEAMKWEGKDESDDREELTGYLGGNPDETTGGQPWCASFMNAVVETCGIVGTGSWVAASFEDWGTRCKCMDGAFAVFGPGAIPGGHVGIVTDNGLKILGGNQRNMVKYNNLPWYIQNKTLIGYRIPPGYEVPVDYVV